MKNKWALTLCTFLMIVVILAAANGNNDQNIAAADIETPAPTALEVGEQTNPDSETETVYITRTGECYHTADCPCVSHSRIAVSLESAAKTYRPCNRCHPPAKP